MNAVVLDGDVVEIPRAAQRAGVANNDRAAGIDAVMTTQFFSVSLLIGVVPTDPINITLGAVALVLVMVRLRSVPAP